MELITYSDGRQVTHAINVGDLLWLPTDTPFGNLTPKLFWVMSLLAQANLRLEQSAAHWSAAMSGSIGQEPTQHRLTAGEAVFAMRRAADELVTLTAVLDERLDVGCYPRKPKYDSIGTAIDKHGNPKNELWSTHSWLLQTLNDLANAHKHSFIDSATTVVGELEPCATALYLPHNDLGKHEAQLYVVSLGSLAKAFTAFLADVMSNLRTQTSSLRDADCRSESTLEVQATSNETDDPQGGPAIWAAE